MSISFGPKYKEINDGKIIGMLTDLNIFSSNIGDNTAKDITGLFKVWQLSTFEVLFSDCKATIKGDVLSWDNLSDNNF